MTGLQEELIDAYAFEMNVSSSSFEYMGRLLDFKYVESRIQLLDVSEIFIYGGGYLGIQLYNAAGRYIKVLAVIDKKRRAQIKTLNIPVIDVAKFKDIYKGQKVIIASIRFYREIQRELLDFIPGDQILSIGEFLGGILK